MDQITEAQSTESSAEKLPTGASTVNETQTSVDGSSPAPTETYTPSYKYKVMDKELEFEDWVKPLVKDKDLEDKFRNLFNKASGIDDVVAARDRYKNGFNDYRKQTEPVMELAQKFNKAYQSGDPELALSYLGVKEQDILKTAYKILQRSELPPEQRQQYNNDIQMRREYLSQQDQLAQFQTQHQQTLAQLRQIELDQALSKPDIAQLMEAFDSKNGAGSFKNEVIQHGLMKWHTTGQDIAPAMVVQELAQKYGIYTQVLQATPPTQQAVIPNAQSKPTLPIVKSGSTSPVKRKISSLEDIEKEYLNQK